MTKAEFKQYIATAQISYCHYNSAAGMLLLLATDQGIYSATFADRKREIPEYQLKPDMDFSKLLLVGTPFQCMVWQALLTIPQGTITHYGAIAQGIGHPQAFRAVARTVASNTIAYIIPCHRVLRKKGDLCGYKWGIERKELLLRAEGIIIREKNGLGSKFAGF